jgi:hypothetical protein
MVAARRVMLLEDCDVLVVGHDMVTRAAEMVSSWAEMVAILVDLPVDECEREALDRDVVRRGRKRVMRAGKMDA